MTPDTWTGPRHARPGRSARTARAAKHGVQHAARLLLLPPYRTYNWVSSWA